MEKFNGMLCIVHNTKMVLRSYKSSIDGPPHIEFELMCYCGCRMEFTTRNISVGDQVILRDSLMEVRNGGS